MPILCLWLTGSTSIALDKTLFSHPLTHAEQRAVRGKTAGAYRGCVTFQWTPAVRALTVLLLRATSLCDESGNAFLQGEVGSPAASLDYSLAKLPHWLLDMFGMDKNGLALARRLFNRSNPERRRAGPVVISLNKHMISPHQIKFFLNNIPITGKQELQTISNQIESAFGKSRSAQPTCIKRGGDATPSSTGEIHTQTLSCPCCGIAIELKAEAKFEATKFSRNFNVSRLVP